MKCKRCDKELIPKEGKRLNPKRIFCNINCQSRYAAAKRYRIMRNNPNYIKRQKERFEKWYKKNKKKQKDLVMKNYNENKDTWNERKFTFKHREKILGILKNECHQCEKEDIRIIHHETYNFPKRNGKRGSVKETSEYLKKYCKFLLGFCSKKCHCEYHKLKYKVL